MAQYKIWQRDTESGPYSIVQLQKLAGSGVIDSSTPTRDETAATWSTLDDILARAGVVRLPAFVEPAALKPNKEIVRELRAGTAYPVLRWSLVALWACSILAACGFWFHYLNLPTTVPYISAADPSVSASAQASMDADRAAAAQTAWTATILIPGTLLSAFLFTAFLDIADANVKRSE